MSFNNNWFVVSGGPSSGKSTTLAHLKELGYETVPEAARSYIDQKIAEGKTLAEIRADEEFFQNQILKMKLEIEGALPEQETVFLDRGIHDSLAYHRLYGYKIDRPLREALNSSYYKTVFLLEMLDFEKDYARIEDNQTAKRLESLIEEAYTEYKIKVIRIPRAPVEERARLILEAI